MPKLSFVFPAVASKSSSGIVGKWGSFSSMRPSTASSHNVVGSSSDLKRGSASCDVSAGAPKPKKFFKSRETVVPLPEDDDELSFNDNVVSKVRLLDHPERSTFKITKSYFQWHIVFILSLIAYSLLK
jgi:hypothetical protein